MEFPQAKWIQIVATRTEGAASSWLSHEQSAMDRGTHAPWSGWAEFSQEMIRAFEPTTDDALARQQLAALKQTSRVAGYIQKFREIRGRIQDMSVQDEFAAFIRGLQPRIKTQVGHWWKMTWLQPCDWLPEWNCGQQKPPVVDQVDREVGKKGRGRGEEMERDQGDKGPRIRARSKQLSPVLLPWTKEARRKDKVSNSSRARARDRGRSPHATFARVLIT